MGIEKTDLSMNNEKLLRKQLEAYNTWKRNTKAEIDDMELRIKWLSDKKQLKELQEWYNTEKGIEVLLLKDAVNTLVKEGLVTDSEKALQVLGVLEKEELKNE